MKIKRFCFPVFIIRRALIAILVLGCTVDLMHAQNKESNDEQEPVWSVSSGAYYYSRYTRYGADLSEDQPAYSIGSDINHESGLSAGFEAFALAGSNGGYEHSAFHAGYEYSLNTSISFTGIYTYSSYQTDTMNVLAGISNTVSLGGTFKVNDLIIFTSYSAFFGGGTAKYFATGVSTNLKIGVLIVVPSVQCCFASQTVNTSLLPKNRGKGKGVKNETASPLTTTITGMSDLSIGMTFCYPLGNGFAASLKPSYVYSPTDLAVSANQFILTVGVEHSIDF